MPDLYAENYTMLKKEIKDFNKWRGILYCNSEDDVLNMPIPLKLIDRFNAVPNKS